MPLSERGLDRVIALGLLLCAVAAAVAIGNHRIEDRYLSAAVAAALVAAPMALGAYAWRSEASRRFGALLVLGGIGMFLTTLANSDASLPYSIGRVAGWGMEVAIIYALLAYPTGYLTSRVERLAVGLAAAIVAVLYLPAAFVTQSLPTPTPWSGCIEACPENAFALGDGGQGLMDVVGPLREFAAAVLFIAVGLVLLGRVRVASPLARTSLTPVLAVAIARFGGASAFLFLRESDAPTGLVAAAALALALTIPLIALGFLVGLLRWRLRTARALERISAGLERVTGPATLQALLAESLDDASLRLYVRGADGGWHDADGAAVVMPVAGPDRFLLEVEEEAGPTALVACDGAIRGQEALLEATRASVRSALEHQRLAAMLEETRDEVAASRARIASAAVDERRRIERDIHDGAQQRLIALGLGIGLAEEALESDPGGARRILSELRSQIADVIEDVRSLSRGIYPPLLADAGPADALRSAALNLPVPVVVRGRELRRYPATIESTVFFCCLEAVQNAIKHGGAVSGIEIEIEDRGAELVFTVHDDGCGFDPVAADGAGITNMRDRLAAIGGELAIGFPAGDGTTVSGAIPVAASTRLEARSPS